MIYKINTRVVAVKEESRVQGCYATDQLDSSGKPVYEEVVQGLGWFVHLEGSHEKLGFGAEHPVNERGEKIQAGDAVEIMFKFP